ncbi:YagU family protein [uncultured Amnibacterium sp.]|uniref:YagU family protein n=1 Tax=uncultured Amnibacterium sp. TaxID=1631851 RepID=UPI0035C996A5
MKTPFGLLDTSAPENRRPGAALVAGIVAGLSSGAVKMGWESLFPPRTPDREVPPVTFLKQRGIDPDEYTYTYNGNQVPWGVLAVHFGFSVVTVAAYSVAAEYFPKVKLLGGAAYGIGAFVVAHEIVLPRLGLSPSAKDLPVEEHASEFFGHIAWLLEAEVVRKATRLAIAGVPDADIRVETVAKLAGAARAALGR